jgi:POT family proton-dependent oligopeptide transporter
MSATAPTSESPPAPMPEFKTILGHPKPLWMLFMSEFWERFAFYGIRWAMVLYIVAQFHGGNAAGEKPAAELYGAYLALVYAGAIFGGYVADKLVGFQRSILLGALFMAIGLFMLISPDDTVFKLGLATIIVGNGLFKPIISTMVGKLYAQGDARRDAGFTIFYMGINIGAMIAPVITGWLARQVFGSDTDPHYQWVFIAAGIGMLLSLVWFWFGRSQLKGIGLPPAGQEGMGRIAMVAVLGALIGVPLFFFLLTIDANALQAILMALFVVPAVMLLIEGIRGGKVARDMVIAMLIIFVFNVLFWMFFEQAGSSFTFLADKIVNREFGSWTFPLEWFQSVNSVAIIAFAPVMAWMWVKMGRANPSIPRKFGLGLIFNGLAFLLLMVAHG